MHLLELDPVRLLDAAPWLSEEMAEGESKLASSRIVVRRLSVPPGPWTWDPPYPKIGYLVLGGLLARGLHINGSTALGLDLVGERDLMQPWNFAPESRSIPVEIDWTVLAPLELAVLDDAFEDAIRLWPTLALNLMRTLSERVWSASSLLAARHIGRLDGRILATLWMLADRWGRVGVEGVTIVLPQLTHEMLARVVAARRPSVTTSLGKLRRLGLVEQRSGGIWVLTGDPVEALQQVAAVNKANDALPTDGLFAG